MKAIEFKDFCCYYRVKKKEYVAALEGICLSINAGEFVTVVGESGSGKTTLLRSCMKLGEYFTGELLINGIHVEDLDVVNENFALIQQEIALYPHLTVYENIAFPLRTMKTPQSEVDVRVRKIADELDLTFLLTRKPKQLSGGQQQKAAIARALIKNPSFLFFDEPFSNIDPKYRVELRELVKKIHSTYRPTVLFVTHDLEDAVQLAHRILVLEDGKLVDDGMPECLREHTASRLLRPYFDSH